MSIPFGVLISSKILTDVVICYMQVGMELWRSLFRYIPLSKSEYIQVQVALSKSGESRPSLL